MRLLRIVLAVLLAGCLGPPPELTGGGLFDRPERVTLDSRGLLVAGRPFLVKGVRCEPVGASGTARDWTGWEPVGGFILMKRVGFSTVRVRVPPAWIAHLDRLATIAHREADRDAPPVAWAEILANSVAAGVGRRG